MPRWALIGSLLIHLGVAIVIGIAAQRRAAHAATQVSIYSPQAPKPPPKKIEEVKPPPPKPVAHKIEAREPVAAPVPAAAQPSTHGGEPPVALGGLEFGNGDDTGPGLEVGGGTNHVAVPESRLRTKVPRRTGLAEEAPCLEDVTKPVPIFKSDLPYTDEARKAGIEGAMTIKITVGADGAVAKVDVLKSVDPALDAAAVAAAMKWRFKPGMRCGKAVAGTFYVYKQIFELGD